jgi:nitroimidazol reductase NimA-like FMN-containing flavoprotein (pyridoxamine 5'-phosphate oxidase superfamily)
MIIKDMTREAIDALLKRKRLGRLGCARDGQPYIVPFSFSYADDYLYSFGTIGKKIEWMRANPIVCVEIDEIVNNHDWQTVVMSGRYEELPDTPEFNDSRTVAHDLLADTEMWWEPGYVKTIGANGEERPLAPIYFRIAITEMTGHQGVPGE